MDAGARAEGRLEVALAGVRRVRGDMTWMQALERKAAWGGDAAIGGRTPRNRARLHRDPCNPLTYAQE